MLSASRRNNVSSKYYVLNWKMNFFLLFLRSSCHMWTIKFVKYVLKWPNTLRKMVEVFTATFQVMIDWIFWIMRNTFQYRTKFKLHKWLAFTLLRIRRGISGQHLVVHELERHLLQTAEKHDSNKMLIQ